jgi:hypothetical protein
MGVFVGGVVGDGVAVGSGVVVGAAVGGWVAVGGTAVGALSGVDSWPASGVGALHAARAAVNMSSKTARIVVKIRL